MGTNGYLLSVDGGYGQNVVNVLATVANVNGKTQAATNLFTVPAGRSAVITDIVVRATNADTVGVVPIMQIGLNPNYNEWLATVTLTGLTATGKAVSLGQTLGATVANYFSAGQVVAVNITTGATATTLTLAFDVLGYLI